MRCRTGVVIVGLGLGFLGCGEPEDLPQSPPKVSGGVSGATQMTAGGDDTGTGVDTGSGTDDESDTGGLPPPVDFNYAFVSSALYVPGELGGLFEADQKCQDLADAAGLGGSYVAWLSASTTAAKARLSGARNWRRTDGRPFVDSVDDLINRRIMYPLRLDENGDDVPNARVVTGTAANGTGYIDPGYGYCADWTSSDPGVKTSGGISDAGDDFWTRLNGLDFDCGMEAHLYCFGSLEDQPMDFVPETGRGAFLSFVPFVASEGRDGADAQCQQEANEAGLAGQYAALLSTEDEAATERFDTQGLTWVRGDGVAIVEDAGDLGLDLLAPISRDVDGLVLTPGLAWTGSADPDAVSDGESCASWGSTEAFGRIGTSGRTSEAWFSTSAIDCASNFVHLYCLEQ